MACWVGVETRNMSFSTYSFLPSRSYGKLLPAGKFKREGDKYQELLDRLLVERA